ncbi:MAG: agmatine deiminase family protein [Deltaproteobacteria bacterium]|nr:agmatine deiminase family protein [Deltaproteobacteria bacterium]
MQAKRRLPAEWEPQDGVLLAWPHEGTDWAPYLPAVEEVFLQIVVQVSRFEEVLVVVPDGADLEPRFRGAGARTDRVRTCAVPTNDTWARDFGPITVLGPGGPVLLDFGFNGWGLKFACDRDNRVTRRLREGGAFGATPLRTVGLVLEGGSVESDGRGTVLTTEACLLGPNRNPHLDRGGIERMLAEHLGADRVLWLRHGHLAGDDTDAHVDTLARFAPGDALLHVACDDPADGHYAELARMAEELERFRTPEGKPYRLRPLPWPGPKFDQTGERLPATYANFLVLDGAVLVPTYRDPADARALDVIAEAFPDRQAIGVDCLPLLLQHGSLHCVSMQLPRGVLRG